MIHRARVGLDVHARSIAAAAFVHTGRPWLVGSALVDVNEEWLEMNLIDASFLKCVCRSEVELAAIPTDVLEKTRARVMTTTEEKLEGPPDAGVKCE